MALTLQQRVNISKSRVFSQTDATIVEKVEQCLRVIAQDILDGTLTSAHAAFVGHVPTQPQMTEWALRALRGNFDTLMLPMIIDKPILGADPTVATDANIKAAAMYSLWPYITLIGTGAL